MYVVMLIVVIMSVVVLSARMLSVIFHIAVMVSVIILYNYTLVSLCRGAECNNAVCLFSE